MLDRLAALVLDEGKWLTFAMLTALVASALWLRRTLRERAPDRLVILGALNRFYGAMIGVMGSGHLLAVAVSGARGTLQGSPWLLIPLGLALAVPGWALFAGADRAARGDARWSVRCAALDAWLLLALLAFGLHNLPLAVPAALNLAYQFHRRRAVGVALLATAVVSNLALFAGSLVFLASGRSFEQFSGM